MTRLPITTVFGGGGAFGVGFNHGVAQGLAECGIDLARWPMLGTSAGSHTAAMLDLGIPFDAVADHWQTVIDRQRRGWRLDGHELSASFLGDQRGTNTSAVTVRVRDMRRVVLRSPEHRLADMIAASSAIVPIAIPHRLDGHRYLDGGVRSIASADLAPAADLLLLITPFATTVQGPAGRIGLRQANREIRIWVERHRGNVLHVVPSPEIAAVGGMHARDIADMRIGRKVHPLAVELGHHVAAAL